MRVTKMHGLGNDFVIIGGQDAQGRDVAALARRLCDRHTGVGADGIIIALPSTVADARMRIINADGSEAEMCGNGIRCFAKYIYERGIVRNAELRIETLAGIVIPRLVFEDNRITGVCVDMGAPLLQAAEIPVRGCVPEGFALRANGKVFDVTALRVGVPHAVVFCADSADVTADGSALEKHACFPEGSNIDFVGVRGRHDIALRTWERGAGATLACGTGACAAAAASVARGLCDWPVRVHVALGSLLIDYQEGTLRMTGPATQVFETEATIDLSEE